MKKPTLLYSDPDYNHVIPVDIAPSILENLLGYKVLFICAREGMEKRLEDCISDNPLYQGQDFSTIGVWDIDLDNMQKILHPYDKVVIVGRSRINTAWTKEVEALEKLCSS
jgi:hypothetical protein